jgi:hypothetical protein
MVSIIILYYMIILRDQRRVCGPSLTETSLCGPYLYLPHIGYLFWHGSTALVCLGLLIIEVPQSHSVGFLWTRDGPLAETSTQHSQETGFYVTDGIGTRDPSKQTAADPSLRPRGHWVRIIKNYDHLISQLLTFVKMCATVY